MIIFSDDSTIIQKIFTDDPAIMIMDFLHNLNDIPTITRDIIWWKLPTLRRSRLPVLAKTEPWS